jgi:simple sugar transport system substrate-binding protein
MEEGIKQFAAQNGVDATMTGAADADPQKQADIIRKLIGEKPNAITVVPNSPEALEEVLKQARAAGIKVVTHVEPLPGFGEVHAPRRPTHERHA